MRIVIVLDASLQQPEAPPDATETLQVAASIAEALGGAEIVPLSLPLLPMLRGLAQRVDVVFNLIESFLLKSQLEPVATSALERAGLRLTGNRAQTLRLCLHKEEALRTLKLAGLPVPRSVVLRAPVSLRQSGASGPRTSHLDFLLPAIVKPCREDGSVGITNESVVYDQAALARRVSYILEELRQPALVEQFIDGRELNLSLLQTPDGVRLLPPAEIDFSGLSANKPHIVSYDAKWTIGSEEERMTPRVFPSLLPNFIARLARLGRRTFSALKLSGYARVDLRLDRWQRPFIVDVNPNCDLAPDAGMAAAAAQAGLSYSSLLRQIAQMALVT